MWNISAENRTMLCVGSKKAQTEDPSIWNGDSLVVFYKCIFQFMDKYTIKLLVNFIDLPIVAIIDSIVIFNSSNFRAAIEFITR